MRSDLPTGTVTLLFTDVEGSTRLLEQLGVDAYGALLAEHRRVCREAFAANGGVEVDTAGDAFFVGFARPSDALAAAAAAQAGLAALAVAVRMGVHTGEIAVGEEGYVGMEVHRAARIAAAGHGGQVLVSSATAALVETPLTDLGEHRFKDLRAPERVFQLGAGEFPPLKSLYRSNLPVPATPFLGREPELAAVAGMLSEPGARLVSLTGPGGTGKTRLALQAAAEASDGFPDGLFWAPLAPLRDPGLVLPEVVAAVGVRDAAGGSVVDALEKGLSGRRMLVLLDNLEHLLPDAAAGVSDLVAACPSVAVVVTSRERLRLPGERVFAVPPMSETEGEALFRRRAADAGVELGDSDELRTLCTRLDNLPLALELAAARMVLFSPAQLLERLAQRLDLLKGARGGDARQETLRATIVWSHDLLDAGEQQLFRRLSVFAGGCDYDAAERVAGADPDTLQSLLDKSLLRRRDGKRGPRFWMLETILEFAAEQLAAAGETAEVQGRHREHYATVAAECYDETWGNHDDRERLAEERDNLRVAFDTALDVAPETALVLASQLRSYWLEGGESVQSEGRAWLAAALATASDRPTPARTSALLTLGAVTTNGGDFDAAHPFLAEALESSRAAKDRVGEGRALMLLGFLAGGRGDLHQARRLLEDAADTLDIPGGEASRQSAIRGIAAGLSALGDHAGALDLQRGVVAWERAGGSDFALAFSLNNLGECERVAGETEAARQTLTEAVALARKIGDHLLSMTLHTLGGVLRPSAPAEALAAFSESLHLAREGKFSDLVPWCLEGAAPIFTGCGNPAHAASLLGAASALRDRLADSRRTAADKAEVDAYESECREALTPEAFAAAWKLGAALDADAAAAWALERWEQAGDLAPYTQRR